MRAIRRGVACVPRRRIGRWLGCMRWRIRVSSPRLYARLVVLRNLDFVTVRIPEALAPTRQHCASICTCGALARHANRERGSRSKEGLEEGKGLKGIEIIEFVKFMYAAAHLICV